MAIQSFDNYLTELGGAATDFRMARDRLASMLSRHTSAGYSSLQAGDFTGMSVTKAQYDALMTTIADFVGTYWPSGHGTNIESYLTEDPGD